MTLPAGQTKAAEYLERTFTGGTFPPAVLLYGPPGSGKSRLAEAFARRWLCSGPEPRPCGSCPGCREARSMRHPDYIVFSAKDITTALAAWRAVLPVAGVRTVAPHLLPLLYRVEQGFMRGLHKLDTSITIKGAAGRSRTEKLDREALASQLYGLEQLFAAAADQAAVADGIAELERLAAFLHTDLLRIDGIREIIGLLSRRPLLGERRFVLLEGVEKMNAAAANAFLKTLEEPSPGTIFFLIAPSLDGLLPTIRSRCALLPVFKMRRAEMEAIARDGLGIVDPPAADGCPGFHQYLLRIGGGGGGVRELLLRFFDELEAGDRSGGIFALAKEAQEGELVVPLLEELESLFAETILARTLGAGADALFVRLLAGVDRAALERLRAATERLLARLPVFHLNPAQALLSLFYDLHAARWGR